MTSNAATWLEWAVKGFIARLNLGTSRRQGEPRVWPCFWTFTARGHPTGMRSPLKMLHVHASLRAPGRSTVHVITGHSCHFAFAFLFRCWRLRLAP